VGQAQTGDRFVRLLGGQVRSFRALLRATHRRAHCTTRLSRADGFRRARAGRTSAQLSRPSILMLNRVTRIQGFARAAAGADVSLCRRSLAEQVARSATGWCWRLERPGRANAAGSGRHPQEQAATRPGEDRAVSAVPEVFVTRIRPCLEPSKAVFYPVWAASLSALLCCC